jgi:hypothetical protein
MNVKKQTPLLHVEEIESCLEFWNRLGFETKVQLPHGDALGFVILEKDGIEVMYQSRASVAADIPPLADAPMRGSFIYFEVDDVDAFEKQLPASSFVIPRRTTFYGAQELVVREPAGNIVVFSQFGG